MVCFQRPSCRIRSWSLSLKSGCLGSASQPHAFRWNVVEIVGLVRRQLDALEREAVVVLPRHVPGQVRLGETDGEEERLVAGGLELLDGPAHVAVVHHRVVRDVVDHRSVHLVARAPLEPVLALDVDVPVALAQVVRHLPRAADPVAGVAELGGEHLGLRNEGPPVDGVVVHAGGRRSHAGEDRGARRVADRDRGIGARETDAATRETVEVGRHRLRIAAEVARPSR